jgi:hypothetical protein
MFNLYFLTTANSTELIFTNKELAPCLDYIRANRLYPQRCMIITPNNRRVTFNQNNEMVFGEFRAA